MSKNISPKRANERGFSDDEAAVVEERSRLRAPLIYEVVREEGEEEMRRPLSSLWWSGIAAGLSMGFSLLAEATLHTHLPDAPWRPLISNIGYTIGFIIVILGRQQLFTEATITPILPLIADPSRKHVWCVARLWGIVFAANMVGTFGFALFNVVLPGAIPDVFQAMLIISREALAKPWFEMFVSAIGAGFLIATVVWLIPIAEETKIHVVVIFTYLIAIADFGHIVAGSTDAFLLVLTGELQLLDMIWRFTVPVLLGNIIGGTALFALLAYAQVMRELRK
jgi:formate/nitrite transporter FocA (FNT family)